MNFQQKLEKIIEKNNSLVCLGLDPDLDKLAQIFKKEKNPLFSFNKQIIDTTYDLVACYKPNIAFYEAYGLGGLQQLKETIDYIQAKYPEIPIILDTKRADIGNSSKSYAKAIFEYWGVDATTVVPYYGLDSISPFFEYKDKITFVLIHTSNPDAKMFQNLEINGESFYLVIAKTVKTWKLENLGIFVGATYPEELKKIREIFPDKIFLSAGIGAQAAEIKSAVRSGINKQGRGIVFNASRSIIFAENPRETAKKLRDEINKYRNL